MLYLNEAREGKNYHIVWLLGSIGKHLMQTFGIKRNMRLRVVRRDPEGGLIIECNGRRLALSLDAAAMVYVEGIA